MEANAIDAAQFRDGQREQWDGAARGWIKWSEMFDRAAGSVSEKLVELAGVEPGSRVLDVACGYGEPTLTAAKRAARGGGVVATDISAEMLGHARERTAAAGLENVEFVEGAASALEFPPRSFDAAVSRWGIIFEPDGEATAARIRGFLKPGARFAISSWGEPAQVPFLSLPIGAAIETLDVPPPSKGMPGPLSRPTPEALGGLLEGGGFTDVAAESLEVTLEWDSPEDFATYIREIAPPVNAIIDPHPKERRDAVWAAITEAAREYGGGEGPLQMRNAVVVAVGRA